MEMQGRHGARGGEGMIRTIDNTGRPIYMEYRYSRAEDGTFSGSISSWAHTMDAAGLTAYLSRVLPTRQAMIEWIFQKADKLAQED